MNIVSASAAGALAESTVKLFDFTPRLVRFQVAIIRFCTRVAQFTSAAGAPVLWKVSVPCAAESPNELQ